jgi:hypothetical protein
MLHEKLKGDQQLLPPWANNRSIAIAALCGALANTVLGIFGSVLENAELLGSLLGTCVLLFGFRYVPFPQPWILTSKTKP